MQARRGDDEPWQDFDAVYGDLERPDEEEYQPFTPLPSELSIRLELIGAAGRGVKRLVGWTGSTESAVGQNLRLALLPASPLAVISSQLDPSRVVTWHALLEVGPEVVRGGAFGLGGAVMKREGDTIRVDDSVALRLDETGQPLFQATPLRSLAVAGADTADYPRVRLRFSVEPERAPSWHHAHFQVSHPGKGRLPVRIESGYVQPQPVILAVDVSNSMFLAEERIRAARRALGALLEQLRPEQPVGLISFAGDQRVVVEPVPLGEGRERLLEAIRFLGPRDDTFIAEAALASLEVSDRPACIVFLTDGEDSRLDALRSSARRARDYPNTRNVVERYQQLLAAYQERSRQVEEAFADVEHRFLPIGIGEADDVELSRLADLAGSQYLRLGDDEQQLVGLFDALGSELSGQVTISFLAPETPAEAGGEQRTVQLRVAGYDAPLEAAYQVPTEAPDPRQMHLLLTVTVVDNSGQTRRYVRRLTQAGTGFDPWSLVAAHQLGLTVVQLPPRVILARKVDNLIAIYLAGKEPSEGDEQVQVGAVARGMPLATAQTCNRLLTRMRELSGHASPQWQGPTLLLQSTSHRQQDEDVFRRRVLDVFSLCEGPGAQATRADLARWGFALGAVEAELLSSRSVNAMLLARTQSLAVFDEDSAWTAREHALVADVFSSRGNAVGDPSGEAAWVFLGSGELWPVLNLPAPSNGASSEELAEQFSQARTLLEIYCQHAMPAARLSGSSAQFRSLCTYFDRLIRAYCYATIVLNEIDVQQPESFDPEQAKEKADNLCEFSSIR